MRALGSWLWAVIDFFCSNVFPHSTFNWVGIDGTQVLCHMTPVGELKDYLNISCADIGVSQDTYTAQATVGDIQKGLTNHKVLALSATRQAYAHIALRTSSPPTPPFSYSETVMVEAARSPLCLRM